MSKAEQSTTFDWSDAFDKRITLLDKTGVPKNEVDAAANVYERLVTARAIVNSSPANQGNESDLLVAVFNALNAEARALT